MRTPGTDGGCVGRRGGRHRGCCYAGGAHSEVEGIAGHSPGPTLKVSEDVESADRRRAGQGLAGLASGSLDTRRSRSGVLA